MCSLPEPKGRKHRTNMVSTPAMLPIAGRICGADASYFQGDGVMRVGMANGKRVENAISIPDNRVAIAGPHVKMTRTAYVNPPQLYSEYSDFVELTGKKHNSITLFSEKRGGGDMPFWSYYTDKSDASYIDGTLALKDIVASDLELKLTAEPGTYTVDPLVNAGCAIPEMVVQSGAALKLTTQQWGNYAFTKPIRLEGGSLEIDGTTANITRAGYPGHGHRDLNGGTVSGTVEKSVQVVINGGNIDVPTTAIPWTGTATPYTSSFTRWRRRSGTPSRSKSKP